MARMEVSTVHQDTTIIPDPVDTQDLGLFIKYFFNKKKLVHMTKPRTIVYFFNKKNQK